MFRTVPSAIGIPFRSNGAIAIALNFRATAACLFSGGGGGGGGQSADPLGPLCGDTSTVSYHVACSWVVVCKSILIASVSFLFFFDICAAQVKV
jgi:hypothetical protein